MTWMMTQKVFKNNAILASRMDKMGTSGRSSSVCPIRWPVARAHMRSKLFIQHSRKIGTSPSYVAELPACSNTSTDLMRTVGFSG